MEFPDYGLVRLSPRDLTGPGIEFFSAPIFASGLALTVGYILPAEYTSLERLYAISWAGVMVPDATNIGSYVRMALIMPSTEELEMWGQNSFQMATSPGVRRLFASPFLVIPGGHPYSFSATFNTVQTNGLESYLWGYSFPKGNVLIGV